MKISIGQVSEVHDIRGILKKLTIEGTDNWELNLQMFSSNIRITGKEWNRIIELAKKGLEHESL